MAFIICDDHNLDVEADGVDNAVAKQLMLTDAKPDATPRSLATTPTATILTACRCKR